MQRFDTIEELHGQPCETVVRASDGDLWERHSLGWDNLSTDGAGGIKGSADIARPALLLWHPDWSRFAPA